MFHFLLVAKTQKNASNFYSWGLGPDWGCVGGYYGGLGVSFCDTFEILFVKVRNPWVFFVIVRMYLSVFPRSVECCSGFVSLKIACCSILHAQ